MRRVTLVLAGLLAVAIGAGAAHADGLPVLGVDVGGTGVVNRSGEARYVTISARRDTVVARVSPHSGRILASALVPGATFTIPAVAYDGSADGLSADGQTLVLIQPRASFPRARTSLAILDAAKLRVRAIVRLRGDFSFDAISPRGSLLYLIQYVSPRDPTAYRVRAYDVDAGRLLRQPIVDPREPGEKMGGMPVTRASSADGRWAYTLYSRAGDAPFVHALDTSNRTARCIDLDGLARKTVSRLRLHPDAARSELAVVEGKSRVAVIDTRTFQVRTPDTVESASDPGRWKLAAAGGIALVGAGALVLLRRRRHQPALVP